MKNNSIAFIGIKNFIRDKKNIISVILISLIFSLILFCFSYAKSIHNYWDDSVTKLVDYRTYIVSFDSQKYDVKSAIKKLKGYNHVVEVFDEESYLISMKVRDDEIVKNKENGIFLIGSIKNPINIIYGKDLSDYDGEKMPLICAKQFYPFIENTQQEYVKSKSIDITDKIGYEMNMSFILSEEKEQFEIVGLYDAEANHTHGNVCYTTLESVKKLNNKYQSEVFNNEEVNYVYMIIDNIENKDIVSKEIESDGFKINISTLHINKDMGNTIIKFVSIISLITICLSVVAFIFIIIKKIVKRKDDYLILKTSGYSDNKIILINNIELLCNFVFGLLFSLVFYTIYIYLFQKIYLYDKIIFSKLNIQINYIAVIVTIAIAILIILFSSVYLKLKLIKNKTKRW